MRITIDNKQIDAPAGTTVLKAALSNGIYIPHYCWHPILSVSGNCRMCVVEVAGRPKPEVSCNLAVADGMVIKTDTPQINKIRAAVLEFFLINHPLDCPICDQAGECLLQDYHFKYSGQASRFGERKNHGSKAVDIGRHLKLDNERCILCTRCVRFCTEIAHSPELCVSQRGDHSFITTAPGKSLNNPYSLSTAELCPVGALTARDFRFKKRVWLLKSTPSVCPNCSNGCPIWIDHADGIMYRWRGRNTFLCDEGRLSYKEWQTETRVERPLVQTGQDAVILIKSILKDAGDIVGIISARCSCEEIDAVRKLKKIYKTSRVVSNPTADDIIIKADKNPNSYYLKDVEEIPQNIEGDVLVVAGELGSDDLLKILNFKWKAIIQITHDAGLIIPGCHVVLPRATFAETNGSFVNYAGVRQEFSKAFAPKGESKSVKEWVELWR